MQLEAFDPDVLQARVPAGSRVFRLAKFKSTFDASPAGRCPALSEFSPSKADAEEAAAKGWPAAGISLWDLARTAVDTQTAAAQVRDRERAGDDAAKLHAADEASRVAYLANVDPVHAMQCTSDGSPAYLLIHAPATKGPDPDAHVALFGLPCKYPPRKLQSPALEENRQRLLQLFQRDPPVISPHGPDAETP